MYDFNDAYKNMIFKHWHETGHWADRIMPTPDKFEAAYCEECKKFFVCRVVIDIVPLG